MLKNRILLYIFFIALVFGSCAKRGTITGGPQDTIPPQIVSSSPKNMTTNFSGNEIRIDFDEYIKIKDANKQLIVSPPMETQPSITPMGSASKFIKIAIKDTLQPNTTYSFNFGQSITDNNEGNPYSQYKFVFSTGSYIDSLSLKGRIKDAYSLETDNFVTVMLYEANETFNDSTIYKEKPRYVTNTLDSLVYFSLENLKAGKYHLLALKDINNNYKFDPKVDKIAFLDQTVSVPDDSLTLYELELFQQQLPYKPLKPAQANSNKLYAPYEGDYRGMALQVRNGADTKIIRTLTTKMRDKDSLQVWLPRNITQDSLKVTITHKDSIKDFTVKWKEMKAADSLGVDAVQKGTIDFRDTFRIRSNTPLIAIDTTKISLIDKDSVAVPFRSRYLDFEQDLELDFEKQEDQKYTFTLMPGALRDFYETENDTLQFRLATMTYGDYGNLRLSLENVNRFPLILELIDSKDAVTATYYSEGETKINFDNILPDTYKLRVIYDDNRNREWDTGNYLEKRQPEEVIYYNGTVKVLALWDVEQSFNLGG